MRAVLLPLLLVTMTLAGCADDPDPTGDQGAAATPVGATPTPGATPSSVSLEHDHTSGEPASTTFQINTTGPYNVFIGFRGDDATQACAGVETRIVVKDPSGGVYADVSGSNVMVPCSAGGRNAQGATLPVGTWTVEFSGRGAIKGVVEIAPM